jgi:hypothetical protein
MTTRTSGKLRQRRLSHIHLSNIVALDDRKDSIDRRRNRHHDTAFDGQKNHLDFGLYVHRPMVRHAASSIVRGEQLMWKSPDNRD